MANNTAISNNDKISKFLTAIEKYADIQKEKINNEVEEFKKAEIKKASDEGLKDAYALIQREMAASRTNIFSEMAKRENSGKKEIFKKRSRIMAEVFEKAKAKLQEYTSTEQYKSLLLEDAKEISDFFGNKTVVLYLNTKDMAFSDRLTSLFTGKCSAETANDIVIGGIRALCEETQTVIDKSLDTKLESQKQWFISNSGLKVL